jgi:hypothetical protein
MDYQKTQYILENLVIRTKGVSVQIQGDGNIIRNCIIKSEGNAAIVLAGPNGVIENNKIILRNRWIPSEVAAGFDIFGDVLRPLKEILPSRSRPRAAIVLRQASGTRIIGNSIEVEGASGNRHAIYVKDASTNVLAQGNRIIGPAKPAFFEPGSEVMARDNQLAEPK